LPVVVNDDICRNSFNQKQRQGSKIEDHPNVAQFIKIIKNNVSAVAEQSKKIQEAVEESDDKEELVGKEKFVHRGNDVDRINEFPFTQFYEELLTQVIQDADSQDVNDTILEHLSEALVPEAFSLSLKGGLYKYLPKGSKKYNLIYMNQIPKIIDFFLKQP